MRGVFFLILMACVAGICGAQKQLSEAELKCLDNELSKAGMYDRHKLDRLDSLKLQNSRSGADVQSQLRLWTEIAREYETFISDSALLYYTKAVEVANTVGDSTALLVAKLGRIKVLGVLGLFKEGVDELTDVESGVIPEKMRSAYLDTGRQLYSYMAAFAQSGVYYDQYSYMLNFYRNEQLKTLDHASPVYREFLAEHYYSQGLAQRAKSLLLELV